LLRSITCIAGVALFAAAPIEAKIFLLLDERLKKSQIEQVIYKFVPLTNAAEVELNYVQNFLDGQKRNDALKKLKKGDHLLYLDAKEPAPAGSIDRKDLWRLFAEVAPATYAGKLKTHFLASSITKLPGAWGAFRCVHESGSDFKSGAGAVIQIKKLGKESDLELRFREIAHRAYLGQMVCINSPKADVIFELEISQSNIALSLGRMRFSAFNDAQALPFILSTDRRVEAPLALEIEPQVNENETEFFFQGDRITCEKKRCRKKSANFLLPQMTSPSQTFELAVRSDAASYFRGVAHIVSGKVRVASAPFTIAPHNWVAEVLFAIKNPSEYKSIFLGFLAALVAFMALVWGMVRTLSRIKIIPKDESPRQTSASVLVGEGNFEITASKNPFGCILVAFGGIVKVKIAGERVVVDAGGKSTEGNASHFMCTLNDGYNICVRNVDDKFLLEAYLVSH